MYVVWTFCILGQLPCPKPRWLDWIFRDNTCQVWTLTTSPLNNALKNDYHSFTRQRSIILLEAMLCYNRSRHMTSLFILLTNIFLSTGSFWRLLTGACSSNSCLNLRVPPWEMVYAHNRPQAPHCHFPPKMVPITRYSMRVRPSTAVLMDCLRYSSTRL